MSVADIKKILGKERRNEESRLKKTFKAIKDGQHVTQRNTADPTKRKIVKTCQETKLSDLVKGSKALSLIVPMYFKCPAIPWKSIPMNDISPAIIRNQYSIIQINWLMTSWF